LDDETVTVDFEKRSQFFRLSFLVPGFWLGALVGLTQTAILVFGGVLFLSGCPFRVLGVGSGRLEGRKFTLRQAGRWEVEGGEGGCGLHENLLWDQSTAGGGRWAGGRLA
jgi:hypothetical protein